MRKFIGTIAGFACLSTRNGPQWVRTIGVAPDTVFDAQGVSVESITHFDAIDLSGKKGLIKRDGTVRTAVVLPRLFSQVTGETLDSDTVETLTQSVLNTKGELVKTRIAKVKAAAKPVIKAIRANADRLVGSEVSGTYKHVTNAAGEDVISVDLGATQMSDDDLDTAIDAM